MIDEKIIALGPINITIQSVSAKWGNITNETTQLIFNVSIFNPIALTIQMPQIMFNIKMNNITLGAGNLNNTFFLTGNEYTNVEMITTIDNSMLDDWFVSHIKNNESSFLKITISSVIKYEEVSFVIDDFLIYTHQFKTDILGSEI
jgi:LEA14-like dessication related protein